MPLGVLPNHQVRRASEIGRSRRLGLALRPSRSLASTLVRVASQSRPNASDQFVYGLDDGVGDGLGDADGDAEGLAVGEPLGDGLPDGNGDGPGVGTTRRTGGRIVRIFSNTGGALLKLSGMVPRALGEIDQLRATRDLGGHEEGP